MDEIRQGIWLVNTRKRLSCVVGETPGYQHFEATDIAGKCGALLAKLCSDKSETIPRPRYEVFASQSGIRKSELSFFLDLIEGTGKVGVRKTRDGTIEGIENYFFSTQEVIQTVSQIYQKNNPTTYEAINIDSLQMLGLRPRTENDIKDELCSIGHSEEHVEATLHLQENFGLVGVKRNEFVTGAIFYNDHIFQDDPTKAVKAMEALKRDEKQAVEDIQELLRQFPGYSVDLLKSKFPAKIVNTLHGVGLLEELEVVSSYGNASFATLPNLRVSESGSLSLMSDIYHKAKLLLSCIRYGQVKSVQVRGKIIDPLWIVNALLQGRWIGPCTAIGEDYRVLELQGVVETRQHSGITYFMRLRQREVGELVRDILRYGTTLPNPDASDTSFKGFQPDQFIIPETKRQAFQARMPKPVDELVTKMLEAIRT